MKKIILITLVFCLNFLFEFGVNAAMPGMAGDIQRSYANTEFGRVHYWEIEVVHNAGAGQTYVREAPSGTMI